MDSMFVRGRLVRTDADVDATAPGMAPRSTPLLLRPLVCPHLTRVSPLIFRQVALGDAQELPRGRLQGRGTKGLY